ncbi:MAG: rhodanese-related sulfurtransferase [Alphaproteobacteria bacterium]|jgi:UPF0176 protein|nr:rhodanese-related sulfurtransferase [Alphaproteobacteria bacterium]
MSDLSPATPFSTGPSIVVAALYQFVRLEDYKDLQPRLLSLLRQHHVKGTLLLAKEGINGTVAGTRAGIDALKAFLEADGRFTGLEYKESFSEDQPFLRTKVRLKKEIVTLGVEGIDPNKAKGVYVDSRQWDALLQDPEVVVIDVRNEYEVRLGTFKNAKNPHTETFRAFPDYVKQTLDPTKHKKIAMCCTGGIRCEKASAYMVEQGFEEVYHIKGGILKYIEDTKPEESLWEGECFVFDGRVSVDQALAPGKYELCHGCRFPISQEDRTSLQFVEGVSCPKCYDTRDEKKRARASERQRQISLAKARGIPHLGEETRAARR